MGEQQPPGPIDLPQAIKDYVATLDQDTKDKLKAVRDKLTQLGASDTMKAQVV